MKNFGVVHRRMTLPGMPGNHPVPGDTTEEVEPIMYNRWSPFSDLLALERDMNSFMSNLLGKAIRPADAGTSATGRTAAWAPLIEAFYMDKNLVVRAWLPGCDPSKIDVQVSGNLLTIKGERSFPYQLEDGQLYSEVAYGRLSAR